ncbi:hypothetical protein C8J57DRAFT_1234310 [Mycena rebaudengoi]|nr:hypothetical protein C8J57DRAFT_1234310 [Mycena rebaudengoi]
MVLKAATKLRCLILRHTLSKFEFNTTEFNADDMNIVGFGGLEPNNATNMQFNNAGIFGFLAQALGIQGAMHTDSKDAHTQKTFFLGLFTLPPETELASAWLWSEYACLGEVSYARQDPHTHETYMPMTPAVQFGNFGPEQHHLKIQHDFATYGEDILGGFKNKDGNSVPLLPLPYHPVKDAEQWTVEWRTRSSQPTNGSAIYADLLPTNISSSIAKILEHVRVGGQGCYWVLTDMGDAAPQFVRDNDSRLPKELVNSFVRSELEKISSVALLSPEVQQTLQISDQIPGIELTGAVVNICFSEPNAFPLYLPIDADKQNPHLPYVREALHTALQDVPLSQIPSSMEGKKKVMKGGKEKGDEDEASAGKSVITGTNLITLLCAVVDVNPWFAPHGQKGIAWQHTVNILQGQRFCHTTISAVTVQNKAEALVSYKKVMGLWPVSPSVRFSSISRPYDGAKDKSEVGKARLKKKHDDDQATSKATHQASMCACCKSSGLTSLDTLDSGDEDKDKANMRKSKRHWTASTINDALLNIIQTENTRRAGHDASIASSLETFVSGSPKHKVEFMLLFKDLVDGGHARAPTS